MAKFSEKQCRSAEIRRIYESFGEPMTIDQLRDACDKAGVWGPDFGAGLVRSEQKRNCRDVLNDIDKESGLPVAIVGMDRETVEHDDGTTSERSVKVYRQREFWTEEKIRTHIGSKVQEAKTDVLKSLRPLLSYAEAQYPGTTIRKDTAALIHKQIELPILMNGDYSDDDEDCAPV